MRLVSAIWEEYYPFHNLPFVDDFAGTRDPDDLRKGDILVTWGGEDISPMLYNRGRSRYTGAGVISRRDEIEWNLMRRAVELGVPIIGVCRGGQMLCALAGGYLIQHVNNHSGRHVVRTFDDRNILVNSIHHQMMYPFGVEHELVAWCPEHLSDVHYDVDKLVTIPLEPEFVYFPKVKGFAIQWHPEMMEENSEANEYVLNYITNTVEATNEVV